MLPLANDGGCDVKPRKESKSLCDPVYIHMLSKVFRGCRVSDILTFDVIITLVAVDLLSILLTSVFGSTCNHPSWWQA